MLCWTRGGILSIPPLAYSSSRLAPLQNARGAPRDAAARRPALQSSAIPRIPHFGSTLRLATPFVSSYRSTIGCRQLKVAGRRADPTHSFQASPLPIRHPRLSSLPLPQPHPSLRVLASLLISPCLLTNPMMRRKAASKLSAESTPFPPTCNITSPRTRLISMLLLLWVPYPLSPCSFAAERRSLSAQSPNFSPQPSPPNPPLLLTASPPQIATGIALTPEENKRILRKVDRVRFYHIFAAAFLGVARNVLTVVAPFSQSILPPMMILYLVQFMDVRLQNPTRRFWV